MGETNPDPWTILVHFLILVLVQETDGNVRNDGKVGVSPYHIFFCVSLPIRRIFFKSHGIDCT